MTIKQLDVRTIPESWIYLQDVPTLSFGIVKEDIDKIASIFNNNSERNRSFEKCI